MKDRLKTVFNRSSRRAPVEDDVPDYNAIFSANKKPDPKKPQGAVPPPAPQAQLTDANKSSGFDKAEDIEDAHIVSETPRDTPRPAPTAQASKPEPSAEYAAKLKVEPRPE